MSKTRYTVRPNQRLQKLQRDYRKQQGVYKNTYLAKKNGRVKVPGKMGFWYVHDPNGADANGNTTYGPIREMPMLAGATIMARPNTRVDVITIRDVDYIAGSSKAELDRMGIDAHQTNLLDPARQASTLVEHLQNLQAYSTPGVATVQVQGGIYRKSDGTYGVFTTTGGYDLITGNTPAADMQRVICMWFDTDAEEVTITASSEISQDTDLKAEANIATRLELINECAASAPANGFGITAWVIFSYTTSITNNNKLDDLRGIVGAGSGNTDFPIDITSAISIASNRQKVVSDYEISTGGSLTIDGKLTIV